MTVTLAQVTNESELFTAGGGRERVENLASEARSIQWALQTSLDDVLRSLASRTPPVTALSNPVELKTCVLYGALRLLYMHSVTTGSREDVNAFHYGEMRKAYESEMQSLRPTVSGDLTATPFGIALSRR